MKRKKYIWILTIWLVENFVAQLYIWANCFEWFSCHSFVAQLKCLRYILRVNHPLVVFPTWLPQENHILYGWNPFCSMDVVAPSLIRMATSFIVLITMTRNAEAKFTWWISKAKFYFPYKERYITTSFNFGISLILSS